MYPHSDIRAIGSEFYTVASSWLNKYHAFCGTQQMRKNREDFREIAEEVSGLIEMVGKYVRERESTPPEFSELCEGFQR